SVSQRRSPPLSPHRRLAPPAVSQRLISSQTIVTQQIDMTKKHKKDIVDVSVEEDDELQLQTDKEAEGYSKKKHKNKKIRKREERIEVKIETVHGSSDKSLPLIGYFPSGYDPEKRQRDEEPRVRVLKNMKRNHRYQLVVSPNQSSTVEFVGTNYSGEAAAPQICSYALGVLDKQSQTLKIVQIEANKAKKERALRANRDPEAQEDLNKKMADAKVNTEALEVSAATTSSARNIPPHDISATMPQQAYPLEKIILKGEWRYLLDIAELLQEGKDITPAAYPVFVCNRVHKIDEFKDKNSMDGFSAAKNHKLPNILTQKFNDMFANPDSKRLADDKRDLLISYVLVLTLYVDNFKTEFSDIAKDLRMSTGALRRHFEHLGCKFIRENSIMLATLPAPLKFPEVRMRRRR
ncbi:RNA polymerase I associated factor, A49-like protein, partial [Cynara cardunculus var. scolymus]